MFERCELEVCEGDNAVDLIGEFYANVDNMERDRCLHSWNYSIGSGKITPFSLTWIAWSISSISM